MPRDLVLVRHGQSEGNVASAALRDGDDAWVRHPEFSERHSSWWRLTDLGVSQAQGAGEWIMKNLGEDFDRYYTSGYTRAMETSAYLGLPRARWFIEPRLRERDRGIESLVSGEEHALLQNSRIERESAPLYWRPLGGESIADCCVRVRDILGTLTRELAGQRAIVVCHGEVMESFRVVLERMTAPEYARWTNSDDVFDRIHNGQVFQFTRQDPDDASAELSKYFRWWRSVCTSDLALCDPKWRELQRPVLDNAALLELAHQTPRIID